MNECVKLSRKKTIKGRKIYGRKQYSMTIIIQIKNAFEPEPKQKTIVFTSSRNI